MIHHIRIFLILALVSCKQNYKVQNNDDEFFNKDQTIATVKETEPNSNLKESIKGYWSCSTYMKDPRVNSEYDDNYAKEFSNYSALYIDSSKINIGSCSLDYYLYKYPTKIKKFEQESVFISQFKPQIDSVSFLGTINSLNKENCTVLEDFTFYFKNDSTIILHDRGYFFTYNKQATKPTIQNCTSVGTPGNNRDYWKLDCTIPNVSSLQEGYDYFKRNFPYGAENLLTEIPKNDLVLDGASYVLTNQSLTINKANVMGTLFIKFTLSDNNSVDLIYEMQYLDE